MCFHVLSIFCKAKSVKTIITKIKLQKNCQIKDPSTQYIFESHSPSDGTWIDSKETRSTRCAVLCRHNCFFFGKRLNTILLRHQRYMYPDLPSARYRIRCGFIFSTLESGLKNFRILCWIGQMRANESPIRKEKVADSRISVCVAKWSTRRTSQSCGPEFEFRSDHYLDLFDGSHEFKSGGQACK